MKKIILLSLLTLLGCISYAQNWTEVIKMQASDRANYDYYGKAIALSGDYAIVGVPDHSPAHLPFMENRDAGCAYILKNTNGTWEEVQQIYAADATEGDLFGSTVVISGDYAIIGALGEGEDENGENPLDNAGSAYVFKNNNGTWEQVAKLLPEIREARAKFGKHMAMSGNTVVISSTGYNEEGLYVFSNINGSWQQSQRIYIEDLSLNALALEENTIVLGNMDNSFKPAGCCTVYINNNGTWEYSQELIPANTDGIKSFGYSVDLSGDYMIVGAPYRYTPNSNGYAYIYKKIVNVWTEMQQISSSDLAPGDYFGMTVAIEGDYAIVGAPYEDEDKDGNNSLLDAGSAYVFNNVNDNWSQTQKMVPSERGEYDNFSETLTMSGNKAIIGVMQYSMSQGAVFCYDFNGDIAQDVESFKQNGISIYPVPATTQLNLKFNDNVVSELAIYDAAGTLMYINNSPAAHEAINLAAYTNGLYLIKIKTSKGIFTQKIVKQ